MKVQVEEVSPIEKKLSIEVEPAVVTQELSRAYADLSKQVKIPGFRPGKVPRRILEQRYKVEVEADVARRVQLKAYFDAITEQKVEVVADPMLAPSKLVENQPFAFTARVEVKPKVVAKDYRGLTLPKLDVSVGEDKVKEQLTRMLESSSEVVPVEGRDVAAKADFAVIDFTATMDGKEFPGNTGTGVTVEVAEGELVNANLAQLEGVKVGEVKAFDYTFPADYRVEEIKGKTAQFSVTLKELKVKKVPAADDAWAEKMGGTTLAAFQAKIRADLERAAKGRAEADDREAIIKALSEKNAFEVPKAMIDRATDMMLDGAFRSMARSGVDLRSLGLDLEKMREEFRPKGEAEVRGQLLFESVGLQEKIDASDDEVEKKLAALAEEAGQPIANVRKQFKSAEDKESLKHRIREEKILAVIREAATRS